MIPQLNERHETANASVVAAAQEQRSHERDVYNRVRQLNSEINKLIHYVGELSHKGDKVISVALAHMPLDPGKVWKHTFKESEGKVILESKPENEFIGLTIYQDDIVIQFKELIEKLMTFFPNTEKDKI